MHTTTNIEAENMVLRNKLASLTRALENILDAADEGSQSAMDRALDAAEQARKGALNLCIVEHNTMETIAQHYAAHGDDECLVCEIARLRGMAPFVAAQAMAA